MKRAALILAVISSLLLSGCGGVELYLPSYGTNEVPESFFTGQPSDASIVFPPAASMHMSSGSGSYRDITISTLQPVADLMYAADISLSRVRTQDDGLTLSGSSSATIRFSAYRNDIVAENIVSGNATVNGTLPEGPVVVQISTSQGVFHFKFDLITEISF